jgi:hypothetical protein
MDEHDFAGRETRLREAVRSYEYPPTPDIARSVADRLAGQRRRSPGRRLAWGAALTLAILLLTMLAVPSVRAAVLEFIQVGAVRIFFTPTESGTPTAGGTPTAVEAHATGGTPISTPAPSHDHPLLLNLAGETTLSEAQERVDFPSFASLPPDLGETDRVFVQRIGGGPVVILVWASQGSPIKSASA